MNKSYQNVTPQSKVPIISFCRVIWVLIFSESVNMSTSYVSLSKVFNVHIRLWDRQLSGNFFVVFDTSHPSWTFLDYLESWNNGSTFELHTDRYGESWLDKSLRNVYNTVFCLKMNCKVLIIPVYTIVPLFSWHYFVI